MNYKSKNLSLETESGTVVVPFACEYHDDDVMNVRLVSRVEASAETYVHVTMTLYAPEGTMRVFWPLAATDRLLVVPTVVTVHQKAIAVPVLNMTGKRTKLPVRRALGKWIPLTGT